MNRNNHEDNTNKARHNIHEYAQKNSEKYIKKIDKSSHPNISIHNYEYSLITFDNQTTFSCGYCKLST